MLSKKAPDNTQLNNIIKDVEDHLIAMDPAEDEYAAMVSNLETLYKLRSGNKPTKTELKDWIPLMGSIGSILVIITFEAFGNTMTSKALSFVSKPKA